MTYAGLFEKAKTVGEARRMKLTFLSKIKDDDDISRLEIESEYKKRVWEIRDSRKEGCFG